MTTLAEPGIGQGLSKCRLVWLVIISHQAALTGLLLGGRPSHRNL
jgi:hypothetical protein